MVYLGFAAAIGVAALLILPLFVRTEPLQAAVAAKVLESTGLPLQQQGETRFSLFPSPRLTLEKVEIGPGFRAASLSVETGWADIFSSAPQPRGLHLVQPVLEISGIPAALPMQILPGLTVENGRVVYTHPTLGFTERLENVNLTFKTGEVAQFVGNATLRGVGFNFDGTKAQDRLQLALIHNDANRLDISGEDFSLRAALPNLPPLALSGKIAYGAERVDLTETKLETKESAGTGRLSFLLNDKVNVEAEMDFSRLKLEESWMRQLFAPKAESNVFRSTQQGGLFPDWLTASLALKADALFYNSMAFENMALAARMENGAVNIARLSANGNGGSTFSLNGNIQETARGARFQGRTDIAGQSLREALAMLDPAASQLPDGLLGNFYVRSNLFISGEQLRLSEADAKITDLALSGGLVTYFGTRPKVEAEVSLTNTNLDYFRDRWRESMAQGKSADFMFKINRSVDFSWLRSLLPVIDLKVNLRGFTLLDMPGSAGSFRLVAQLNEMGVYGAQFSYPEGTLKAEAKVNVSQDLPRIDLKLETPQLNLAYFSSAPNMETTPWVNKSLSSDRWSKDLFDLSWMIGASGNFSLATSRLIYRGANYDRFLLESTLENEQMRVSRLTFERFGGKLDATGTLTGGKVPGLSTNFVLYNADIGELVSQFSDFTAATGRVSVSGAVNTSGINLFSWMQQADAKLSLVGRGVRVKNFSLRGVVDGVLASRSVAEVVANVNRALPTGNTDFSVDGNINIIGGVARTPGLSLTAQQGTGTLNAEMDLMAWKLASNAVYQFPALRSDTAPTLTVDTTGTPENFTTKLDTSSLESFVAKRVVGQ